MIYLLLTLFLLLPERQTRTLISYPFLPTSVQSNLQGWTSFTANLITFNGQQGVILFGGLMNETAQSQALLTQIANPNSTVIIENQLAPEPRYSHCALADADALYTYGGVGQIGEILDDLWMFNATTLEWKLISNSSFATSNCNLIKNNQLLLVLGVNQTGSLQIWQYSLSANTWKSLPYTYGYAVINQGLTWEQTIRKTQTSLDDLSPQESISSSNILYSTQLSINNFCVCPAGNSAYYIVAKNKILLYNMSTSVINWVTRIQTLNQKFQCQISTSWLFIIEKNNQFLFLCYYKLDDFNKTSTKVYCNNSNQYTLLSFILNQDLYFISEYELDGWLLTKNCPQTPTNNNIIACFYGDIFCDSKYRGETCQQSKCPNTLTLIDLSIFSQINYQCNNHGTCVDAECVCDQYWTGDDCSTYTRTACYGELLDNWPVMNCQCSSQIIGGNNCQVTFCYNDCNDQGICLPSGQCLCNKNYFGADCSIAIIQLDQPLSNG